MEVATAEEDMVHKVATAVINMALVTRNRRPEAHDKGQVAMEVWGQHQMLRTITEMPYLAERKKGLKSSPPKTWATDNHLLMKKGSLKVNPEAMVELQAKERMGIGN